MAGDWIKLHRQSLDSQVFSDPILWRLFCWCLMRANWKPGWFQGVEIPSGSFATGREAAGQQLGMSGIGWYRSMKKLQEFGLIELNPNNRFTVISVVKWSFFQNVEQQMNNERTTDEQRMNNKRTTDEQQKNTIEEGKKEKKEKKEGGGGEVVMVFPVKGGLEWGLTKDVANELKSRFPKKDRKAEYEKAIDWLESDNKNLKTPQGMKRFLATWLERSEDKQPVERMRTSAELLEETRLAMESRQKRYDAERLAKEQAEQQSKEGG